MRHVLILILSMFFLTNCSAKNSNAKGDDANVEENEINAQEIIKKIKKGENIFYQNKVIKGILDFTQIDPAVEQINVYRTYINSTITFINCEFKDAIICEQKSSNKNNYFVTFQKSVSFLKSKFHKKLNFKEAEFKGKVNFFNSEFKDTVIFEGVLFENRDNYFSECQFGGNYTNFQRANFRGNANFLKSVFFGITKFKYSVVYGEAQFGACEFQSVADFGIVRMFDGAYFTYTKFLKNAMFNNALFYRHTEFMQTNFYGNLNFLGAIFYGKTRFNKTVFHSDVNFENAKFVLGEPDTNKIEVKEKDNLNKKNSFVFGKI